MEISKGKISLYSSLQSKKFRQRHGLFLAEGEKCALDMLGGFELVNIVATAEWLSDHASFAMKYGDLILIATTSEMKKISSLVSVPEVIAVFRLPEETEPESLKDDELYLCLDGIQDPGNLGTIIRTADWFGFNRIYASRDTVDVFNPKTVQSTMGALKTVKVIYTDLESLISGGNIRNVYGTLLDGKDIFKTELENRGVIVMGNEGKGISEKLRAKVNRKLLIPAFGESHQAESLNVAVATGIVLSAFRNPMADNQ